MKYINIITKSVYYGVITQSTSALNIFSSMKFMLVLLVIFASSLAVGTFIENDYGTLTAKSMIYSSSWLAVLMGFLCFLLIVNFFNRKLYPAKFSSAPSPVITESTPFFFNELR